MNSLISRLGTIHFKWFIPFVMALFVMPCIHAGVITHTFPLDTSGIEVRSEVGADGQTYSLVEDPDLDVLRNPGEPMLPVQISRFLVPVYSRNFTVTVDACVESGVYPLEHAPYPCQNDRVISEPEPPFVPLKDNIDMYSGKPRVEVVDDSFIGGYNHIVSVAVYPVSYNRSDNTLRMYSSISVSLNYEECSGEDIGFMDMPEVRPCNSFIPISELVVNYPDEPMRERASSSTEQSDPGKYVIVTHANLVDSFQELATWKRQKGYDVIVKSLESILSDPAFSPNGMSGREDDAASVRSYLQSIYQTSGGKMFCLLAGDNKLGFPIRYVRNGSNSFSIKNPYYIKEGEVFTPTDNYFSDMTKDWNLSKDEVAGIYTVTDIAVPVSLDIPVGRLMCSSMDEVDIYTRKLILYESNPGRGNNDYLDGMFMLLQHDLRDDYGILEPTFKKLFNTIKLVRDKLTDDNPVSGPNGSEIIPLMKEYGFSSLHGHGNPGCIATTGSDYDKKVNDSGKYPWQYITALDYYSKEECYAKDEELNGLDNLNNNNKPFIAYSIACDVVPFDIFASTDSTRYDKVLYNMGESFTLGYNYGGPAFLGNTRYGLVGSSAYLEKQFGTALSSSSVIGMAEMLSKQLYTSNRHVRFTHSLIGDPEFKIWLGKPQTFNPDIIRRNSSVYVIDENLNDCAVTIWDGLNHPVTYNVTGSTASVPFSPDNSGLMLCSIWKTGYLPVVRLMSEGEGIMDDTRRFSVRDAMLGVDGYLLLDSSAALSLDAVDSIKLGSGLGVKGALDARCDKSIEVSGGYVESCGSLILSGETVVLESGFEVESGGTVEINKSL